MQTGEAASALSHLQAERRTGCLEIAAADGKVCHVYLLMGRAYHAVGPAGQGPAALAEALAWPDVSVDFDERAHLPADQTLDAPAPPAREAPAPGQRRSFEPTMAADARLTKAGCGEYAPTCLFVVVLVLGLPVALIVGRLTAVETFLVGLLVLGGPVLIVASAALAIRYHGRYIRASVELPGGLAGTDIPHVVAPGRPIVDGEPELAVRLPVRCLTGKVGRCRIELYREGIRIWRGPGQPEPSWQFVYEDLLQAEAVRPFGSNPYVVAKSVRLIADRPRMGFFISPGMLGPPSQDGTAPTDVLIRKLGDHGVAIFG